MIPYTKTVSIDVVGGDSATTVLDAPFRGAITRVVANQTDGVAAGYSVDLYDCDPADTPDGLSAAVHKIVATITADNGDVLKEMYDIVRPYINQEIDPDDPSLRPQSRIYAVIAAGGSGSKTVELGYTITAGNLQ